MALTDFNIRNLKPEAKSYKKGDSGGLYLLVKPTGSKLWRLKYRFQGVEQKLAFGAYPEISLKIAREKRDDAKALLAKGIDPALHKKRQSIATAMAAENTFRLVGTQYIDKRKAEGAAPATDKKNRWLLSLLDGDLGDLPVSDIENREVLHALKRIEKRGKHETAHRARTLASTIFKYAKSCGLTKHNPAADLERALIAPKVTHHPAITNPTELGGLLRAIDGYNGNIATQIALKVIPQLFPRPIELRNAEWSEIDFEAKVWRVGASKMKMRDQDQEWPLSDQVIALLREAKEHSNGSKYIFPSIRSPLRPISENTLNAALRRMGFSSDEMCSHGFRSTASTLLNESGKWSPDAIERALSHKDKNKVRAIYNRSQHWSERVSMLQWWSDYLDGLKVGGKVVPLRLREIV